MLPQRFDVSSESPTDQNTFFHQLLFLWLYNTTVQAMAQMPPLTRRGFPAPTYHKQQFFWRNGMSSEIAPSENEFSEHLHGVNYANLYVQMYFRLLQHAPFQLCDEILVNLRVLKSF